MYFATVFTGRYLTDYRNSWDREAERANDVECRKRRLSIEVEISIHFFFAHLQTCAFLFTSARSSYLALK